MQANGFNPILVEWNAPPGRDEKFKQEEIGRIGERRWRQEYECEFLSSDALLIESIVLHNLSQKIKDKKPIKDVNGITFWKEILPNTTYFVGIDPATGSGNDYSVISVFDFPNLEQIALYRSNTMSTNELYAIVKNLLNHMQSIENTTVYFSVENNGVGEGIISLQEADETFPDEVEFVSETGSNRRGMATTPKTKMKACLSLKELIERDDMMINSPLLLNELKSYVRQRGSYSAQYGATDDIVSSLLIIVRLLQEVSTYEQDVFDKIYANDAKMWSDSAWDGHSDYDDDDQGLPMLL